MIRARIPPSREVLSNCDVGDWNSAAETLQLAIRAVAPRQREARFDYPVASSYLPSLLLLATAILTTEGYCQVAGLRAMVINLGKVGRGGLGVKTRLLAAIVKDH